MLVHDIPFILPTLSMDQEVVSSSLVPAVIRTALPPMYRKCPFFLLLRILVKTFHGFHRTTIEYFSALNSPPSLKLASITLCYLFYLQHKFWFKTVSFVAAEISTQKMYQLFFPYISWNKYRHAPVLFMIVLFSKNAS